MKSLWMRFAQDERGFVISAELVLVMTLGVLSMVVGLQAVSSAITQELNDVANAFGAVSQSYNYRSISKRRHAWISGSGFNDRADFCDCNPILQTDIIGHTGHPGHLEPWAGPEGDGPRHFDPPIHHDGRPVPGQGHEFRPSPHYGPGPEFRPGHEPRPDPRPDQTVDPKLCCPDADSAKPAGKHSTHGTGQKHDVVPKLVAPERETKPTTKD